MIPSDVQAAADRLWGNARQPDLVTVLEWVRANRSVTLQTRPNCPVTLQTEAGVTGQAATVTGSEGCPVCEAKRRQSRDRVARHRAKPGKPKPHP